MLFSWQQLCLLHLCQIFDWKCIDIPQLPSVSLETHHTETLGWSHIFSCLLGVVLATSLLNHDWQIVWVFKLNSTQLKDSFKTQTIFLLNDYYFHKIRLKMLSGIIIIQAPTILRQTILLSSDIAESRKVKLRGRLPSKKNLPEWRQLEGSRTKNSRRGLMGITAKATFTVLRA